MDCEIDNCQNDATWEITTVTREGFDDEGFPEIDTVPHRLCEDHASDFDDEPDVIEREEI